MLSDSALLGRSSVSLSGYGSGRRGTGNSDGRQTQKRPTPYIKARVGWTISVAMSRKYEVLYR